MSSASFEGEAVQQHQERAARRWDTILKPWALMSPALIIAVIFFGLPAITMARMSFNLHLDQRLYVEGWSLDQYWTILTNTTFLKAIWTTVQLSVAASVVTVVIGYCFAMITWLQSAHWRLLFIGLAVCPLLISEISIIFGWWMVFPKNGLLSYSLISAGILSEKVSLMYTEFAAFVGLVYLILPFSFFIMLSVFDGIDRKTLEASSDLGGGPLRTLYEVLLPLTKNGLLVAFAQSFIWAMGTYATPSALGPNTLWTMGYLIQEQMLGRQNWPLASALGMTLAVAVMAVMILSRSFAPRVIRYHV